MRYIATVHVQLSVEAETEEQARDIVRNQVLGAGMRFAQAGPSHAVDGVRLDVPLGERIRADRLAGLLGDGTTAAGVEAIAEGLNIRPIRRAQLGDVAIYTRPDAGRITAYVAELDAPTGDAR
jgi:hypothetical protein